MTIELVTLERILIFLLYAPLSLLVLVWLFPRMPRSFRLLAAIMLATQLFFVVMQLFHSPSSKYDQWLWTLGREWNISSAFAAAQLALVGWAALMASWFARTQRAWHRFFVSGYGLLFLLLALMEFYSLKSSRLDAWILPHLLLGGLLACITIVQIETLSKPGRLWLLYLLAGLSLIVWGGVVVDSQGLLGFCDSLIGIISFEGCLNKGTLEEALEYFGGWVALVAMLGFLGDIVPSPSRRVRWTLFLLPPVLALVFTQTASIKPISEQTKSQSASVEFESGAQLHAYRLNSRDRKVTVNLYLSVPDADFSGLGYSLRLIDPVREEKVASVDRHLGDQWHFFMGPGYAPVYQQWTKFDIPPELRENHAYLVALSLWRDENPEFPLQEIRASDRRLLSESQVVLDDFVLRAPPPPRRGCLRAIRQRIRAASRRNASARPSG